MALLSFPRIVAWWNNTFISGDEKRALFSQIEASSPTIFPEKVERWDDSLSDGRSSLLRSFTPIAVQLKQNGRCSASLSNNWTTAPSQEKNSRDGRWDSWGNFVVLHEVVKWIVMWCSELGIWLELRFWHLDLKEYKIREPARGFWVWPPLSQIRN